MVKNIYQEVFVFIYLLVAIIHRISIDNTFITRNIVNLDTTISSTNLKQYDNHNRDVIDTNQNHNKSKLTTTIDCVLAEEGMY